MLTNIQTDIQTDGKRTLKNTEMLTWGMSTVFFGIFLILNGYPSGTYDRIVSVTFLLLFIISMLAVAKNLRNK